METTPDLSKTATLVGEPKRATILSVLLGGLALPASELAHQANITPQTASSHLAKLIEGGLLEVERHGRHRYYRLKNKEVAYALEALLIISPLSKDKKKMSSLKNQDIRYARTCYDHLAGRVGVILTQELVDMKYIILEGSIYVITNRGRKWLLTWNIDEGNLVKLRRKLAIPCLDWTERKYHIAGALGASLLKRMFDEEWIIRLSGTRAVKLTEKGRMGFMKEFCVNINQESIK